LLIEVGESIKTTQAILGHSDLNTTLTIYSHPIPNRSGEQSIAQQKFWTRMDSRPRNPQTLNASTE
jgi:hypothetical protein